jgi:hypothetical protein
MDRSPVVRRDGCPSGERHFVEKHLGESHPAQFQLPIMT